MLEGGRVATVARRLLYYAGDHIVNKFGDEYGDIAALCWKVGIKQHCKYVDKKYLESDNEFQKYCEGIMKYDSSFQKPDIESLNGSCYIATAVYGSYDCPEVWILRRFRDYVLAESWYGRTFIHTYYATSPAIVRWFGKYRWFNNMWRPVLDKMVEALKSKGYEDTPYTDRNW